MTQEIDIREFMDAPEMLDAGPALRAAIAAARALEGPSRLTLAPGDYHLWPETASKRELYVSNTVGTDPAYAMKSIGLLLEQVHDLEVVGQGARLALHGHQTALAIVDSTRVRLDGLTVDWAVPTVIDVTVADAGVDAEGAWRLLTVPAATLFEVEGADVVWLSERSPFTGERYWSGRNALAYAQRLDPSTGRVERGPCPLFDDVTEVTRIDEHTIRIRHSSTGPPDDRDTVYQLREIVRDHPGMLVLDSSDVELRRMCIHYLHGFGLVAQTGENLLLDTVAFRAPEDSGRVTAGFADFVQCSGMRGRIEIRGCTFDGPHDDPINVHGTYLAVAAVEGSHRLTLEYRHDQTAGFAPFSVGDGIELVDRGTLQPVHLGTIAGIVSGPSGRDTVSACAPIVVDVANALPDDVVAAAARGELAVENTTRTPEVTISDCAFVRSPTRAILVTTRRQVRIERCRFETITMACIQIAADARDWWESGPVRDVTIADNRFLGVTAGVLEVAPGTYEGAPPAHGTIRLERNEIEADGPLLGEIRGVESLVLRGNRVHRLRPRRREHPALDAPEDGFRQDPRS
ncbi:MULTISPECIES: hypothetical protein [unclassified Microbacterium]|uniref:hypothetical protein n=1 Tax=unclassified Microbacterium TaxID=2609290 RepID=UPI00364E4F10